MLGPLRKRFCDGGHNRAEVRAGERFAGDVARLDGAWSG